MPDRLTPALGLARLAETSAEFATLFTRGTLAVEFYKPDGIDRQAPHARDEVYVVVSGTGTFACEGAQRPFGPGEVLFVPAGAEHRFEAFTADFATWVFFYGPDGGETPGG